MSLLRTAFAAANGYRGMLGRTAAEGLLVALLESFTLLALFAFINSLLPGNATVGVQTRLPTILPSGPLQLAGIVLLAATLRYVLGVHLEWAMSRLWVGLRRHMQHTMFDLHLNARYEFLLKGKAGEHLHHVIEGPSFAAVFYLHLVRLLSTGIMLVVLFGTLFLVSPNLMGIAVAVAVIYGVVIRRLSNSISLRLGQQQARAVRSLASVVSEGLAAVRYLRTLATQESWIADFDRQAKDAEHAMVRAGFWNTMPTRTLEYLVILFFMGIVLFALSVGGDVISSIPTATVYFLGIVRILPSLSILGNARMQMMQALPYLERYVTLQRSIPPEPVSGGLMEMPDLSQHAVVFQDVRFGYNEQPVIRDVSVIIEPRRLTALVGPSGQGKSTLVDLILRFMDPQEGRITAAGWDIRELNLLAWRQRFAYLGQDAFLFHDSVLANIRYGRAGATDEDVFAAARLADAAEFIERLPQAWETVLADRGQSLSGGQRQRIALARALVSQAEVLLFDEPTSALDPESESRVLETILALKGQRTIVMVTHSDRAIAHADCIFEVRGGRVLPTESA